MDKNNTFGSLDLDLLQDIILKSNTKNDGSTSYNLFKEQGPANFKYASNSTILLL